MCALAQSLQGCRDGPASSIALCFTDGYEHGTGWMHRAANLGKLAVGLPNGDVLDDEAVLEAPHALAPAARGRLGRRPCLQRHNPQGPCPSSLLESKDAWMAPQGGLAKQTLIQTSLRCRQCGDQVHSFARRQRG